MPIRAADTDRLKGPHGQPGVLLLHGGFWRRAYGPELMDDIASRMQALGFHVHNATYARWDEEHTGVWRQTLEDVRHAWHELIDHDGVDRVRSMVLGHSAGGHLALWLATATDARPWLTAALAPVSDLVGAHHNRLSDGGNAVARWMGSEPETDPEAWRLADPMQQSIDARILLLHGAVDEEVPISMSETYVRRCAAIGAPVQFERLEGDHYDVIDVGSSAWAAIETSVLDWYDPPRHG